MSSSRNTDVHPTGVAVYYLPVETRVPLKFGQEALTRVTCARVQMMVRDRNGRLARGWGETPLSVQWVWPSALSYAEREEALLSFTETLAEAWANFDCWGHPLHVGHAFIEQSLPPLLESFNARSRAAREPMPWLAALVCCSPYDIALHDAYGMLHARPIYSTYSAEFMNHDLAYYLEPEESSEVRFHGLYPADFLRPEPLRRMPAWHLVGGLDLLERYELRGDEPKDGYPVVLSDWIARDGLRCLKVKLRGNDSQWDYQRLVNVGKVALASNVDWLTADFNCTVTEPDYVNDILDRIRDGHPPIYGMILYVEQPFPYDLEAHRIDVHSVSGRKPLFMDESAHDWRLVRLGRRLGWSGVALKTCKTQTGALFSLCWAKAHGMSIMVQDLTNPMLAQIPHVLLAAHAGTIHGVETNAMQFYPEASQPEAKVHPGLYTRRNGEVDLSTIAGAGFGYRIDEIHRTLPKPKVMIERGDGG